MTHLGSDVEVRLDVFERLLQSGRPVTGKTAVPRHVEALLHHLVVQLKVLRCSTIKPSDKTILHQLVVQLKVLRCSTIKPSSISSSHGLQHNKTIRSGV